MVSYSACENLGMNVVLTIGFHEGKPLARNEIAERVIALSERIFADEGDRAAVRNVVVGRDFFPTNQARMRKKSVILDVPDSTFSDLTLILEMDAHKLTITLGSVS
jgi:hypothetical protein